MDLLQVVLDQLRESHDVRNSQIRLYQLAKDPTLMLSPAQRGALNFYSSLPHVDEPTLVRRLEEVMAQSTENAVTAVTAEQAPVSWEAVVRTTPTGFRWTLHHEPVTDAPYVVDTKSYPTAAEAQHQADAFLAALQANDAKAWLRWAIVHWAQRQALHGSPPSCQAEVLHVPGHDYVLVARPWSGPFTAEAQEQPTAHYATRASALEPWLQPAWVARGFLPPTTLTASAPTNDDPPPHPPVISSPNPAPSPTRR